MTFTDNGYSSSSRTNHEFRVNELDPSNIGTHLITFYIDFIDHENINPIVRVKKTFNVIIDGECLRTVFTFLPLLQDDYMVGSGDRQIRWTENE